MTVAWGPSHTAPRRALCSVCGLKVRAGTAVRSGFNREAGRILEVAHLECIGTDPEVET